MDKHYFPITRSFYELRTKNSKNSEQGNCEMLQPSHELNSWAVTTRNWIRTLSSLKNMVHGLGEEWQRFWQWETFSPSTHFSFTPPPIPPSTRQTSTCRLLLSLVIITHGLYNPVSVPRNYFHTATELNKHRGQNTEYGRFRNELLRRWEQSQYVTVRNPELGRDTLLVF
jgi:hypothetical protein